MIDRPDSRPALLVTLAAAGVALAGVGTALGVADPLAASGTSGTFVFTNDSVTFVHASQEATVVANLTGITSIELERDGAGRFAIDTERATPLSGGDRERARQIAHENSTIREALADLNGSTTRVTPVKRLTADQSVSFSLTSVNRSNETLDVSATQRYRIAKSETSGNASTVIIDREPAYVENAAAVRIYGAGGDVQYTVQVDLANETVTSITEWPDA